MKTRKVWNGRTGKWMADKNTQINSFTGKPAQHTPTPWNVQHRQDGNYGVGQGQLTAAICDGFNDAAFIVRAANAFDADQAELARLRNCQEELLTIAKFALNLDLSDGHRRWVVDAIAKAEAR